MSGTLQLYEATDNIPGLGLSWEECNGLLVWADGYELAVVLARRLYRREHGLDEDEVALAVNPVGLAGRGFTPDESRPLKPWPHRECRLAVERRLGWRIESEPTCSTCGLAAMGMKEFAVCDGCDQCPECGCDCGKEAPRAE